jgi:hypothetical protein
MMQDKSLIIEKDIFILQEQKTNWLLRRNDEVTIKRQNTNFNTCFTYKIQVNRMDDSSDSVIDWERVGIRHDDQLDIKYARTTMWVSKECVYGVFEQERQHRTLYKYKCLSTQRNTLETSYVHLPTLDSDPKGLRKPRRRGGRSTMQLPNKMKGHSTECDAEVKSPRPRAEQTPRGTNTLVTVAV